MSPALLVSAAMVLLASGLAHLRSLPATRRSVAAHAVLPRRAAGPVVLAVTLVELLLGSALTVAVLSSAVVAQQVLALATATLFLGLAAYAHRAWRSQPQAATPCACGVGESPLGPWVTLRALLLAALSAVGALGVTDLTLAARPWTELVVLVAATVGLAVGLTYLPAARATPAALTLGRVAS